MSVQESDFDLNIEIDSIKREKENVGGLNFFLGQVRLYEADYRKLVCLELEHYPGMTEKEIYFICQEASIKWKIKFIRVIHRVGKLIPGDNIVLVLVAAAHRKESIHATEFIMDFLKSRVPIWKKEYFEQESSWVKSKKVDEDLLLKW